MNPTLEVYGDLEALSRAAAAYVERATGTARAAGRGATTIVLSGGSTPRRLFGLFAGEYRERLPWKTIHLFWSDERFVPYDDPESNYGAARALFVDAVGIPPQNVHPVETDLATPAEAADAYESAIASTADPSTRILFDVALLGLGGDGHTASLFPGHEMKTGRLAAAVRGPAWRPPRERVTLTYEALNRTREVYFLVAGEEKREALAAVLAGATGGEALPAARVRGVERTVFLADRAAAPDGARV